MTGLIDAYARMKQPHNPGSSFYQEKIPEGYRSKLGAIRNFSPEQLQLFQQLFGHVGPQSYLSKLAGGDQSMFGEIEAPALRQFGDIQAGIANKYSGMGLGGRRSSGFRNEQTAAASNFAQELQANRQGLQRQALIDLNQISQMLLGQRPMDRFLRKREEEQPSGWGGLAGAGLGGLGGFLIGGPGGALTGAQLGYGIGSGF